MSNQSLWKIINKKEPILAIGSISMVLGLVNYYFNNIPVMSTVSKTISTWTTSILTVTALLSALLVIRTCGKQIQRRQKGVWPFAAFEIVLFLAVVIIAFQPVFTSGLTALQKGTVTPLYTSIANDLYSPISNASKAIVGFFALAAAYRVYRGRTPKGIAAAILTFLVMIRMSTLGELITPALIPFTDYVVATLETSAYRGFLIAAGFGGILMGFRFLLGRELRALGRLAEVEE